MQRRLLEPPAPTMCRKACSGGPGTPFPDGGKGRSAASAQLWPIRPYISHFLRLQATLAPALTFASSGPTGGSPSANRLRNRLNAPILVQMRERVKGRIEVSGDLTARNLGKDIGQRVPILGLMV